MAIHYKRDGGLSICGYSGYGSKNSSNIDKVTCKRCLYIIKSKQTLELKNRDQSLTRKSMYLKNIWQVA